MKSCIMLTEPSVLAPRPEGHQNLQTISRYCATSLALVIGNTPPAVQSTTKGLEHRHESLRQRQGEYVVVIPIA